MARIDSSIMRAGRTSVTTSQLTMAASGTETTASTTSASGPGTSTRRHPAIDRVPGPEGPHRLLGRLGQAHVGVAGPLVEAARLPHAPPGPGRSRRPSGRPRDGRPWGPLRFLARHLPPGVPGHGQPAADTVVTVGGPGPRGKVPVRSASARSAVGPVGGGPCRRAAPRPSIGRCRPPEPGPVAPTPSTRPTWPPGSCCATPARSPTTSWWCWAPAWHRWPGCWAPRASRWTSRRCRGSPATPGRATGPRGGRSASGPGGCWCCRAPPPLRGAHPRRGGPPGADGHGRRLPHRWCSPAAPGPWRRPSRSARSWPWPTTST